MPTLAVDDHVRLVACNVAGGGGRKDLHDTVHTTANGHFERFVDELDGEYTLSRASGVTDRKMLLGISAVRLEVVTDWALVAHD